MTCKSGDISELLFNTGTTLSHLSIILYNVVKEMTYKHQIIRDNSNRKLCYQYTMSLFDLQWG